MTVHSILAACATDLLDTEQEVTVEQVVFCARRNHPEEFAAETERMVTQAAGRLVKDIMRALSEDDHGGQLRLPGVELPSAIAVPAASGYVYIRSDKATWPQLLAGREVRLANVVAAQAKLDVYDDALKFLRPAMSVDHSLTVGDVAKRFGRKAS